MSTSSGALSPSRAVVVWQPRPTLLGRLKSIPPVAIVVAAGVVTYAAVAFIAPSFAPLPKAAIVVADVPARPAPAPSPKAASVENMPRPAIVPVIAPAPPPVAAAPVNPVAFVAPLVAALAPLAAMPRASVAPRQVARIEREFAPIQRPMRAFAPMNRAFAPMMRGGFPMQRFAGVFPRGGFGLGRGFGGFRLFRR